MAAAFQNRRNDFHEAFIEEFPDIELCEKDRSGLDIAALAQSQRANLEGPYRVQYRLYSRYAHGNLSAMAGQFDDIEREEEKFPALLLVELMKLMEELGAETPDFSVFEAKAVAL